MWTPDLSDSRWRKSTRSSGANNCVEVASGTQWRKSTRSSGGADNRVEVASGTGWRTSSRSSGNSNCVEVAADERGGWVAIRDSKHPDGPALVVTPTEFAAFVHALKTDRLA